MGEVWEKERKREKDGIRVIAKRFEKTWGEEERRKAKILFVFMSLRDFLRLKILRNMGKISLFRMEGGKLKWVGKFTRDRALLLLSLHESGYGNEAGVADERREDTDFLPLKDYIRVEKKEYRENIELPALVTAEEAVPFFLKVSERRKLILKDRGNFVYLNLLFLVGDSTWIRDLVAEVVEEWKIVEEKLKGKRGIEKG